MRSNYLHNRGTKKKNGLLEGRPCFELAFGLRAKALDNELLTI